MTAIAACCLVLAGQSPRPELTALHPPAVTRGQIASVFLKGKHFPAETRLVLPLDSPIQYADCGETSLTARFTVPDAAGPELVKVRVLANGQLANFRPLWIDPLPVAKVESANHRLNPPCAVYGRIAAESCQFFDVRVPDGERLSVEVVARRMGSPLDPAFRILDAATGRDVAFADDSPGLHSDCRVILRPNPSGDYRIELRDARHRGGDDFQYVLRVGDLPAPVAVMPAAVRRGTSAEVRVTDATGEEQAVAVAVAADAGPAVSVIPLSRAKLAGFPLPLLVSDHDERAEAEPNDSAEQANEWAVPGGVTGRFATRGDKDVYKWNLAKGQKIRVTAETAALGSPADVLLAVRDAAGKELVKSDANADVESVEFTAENDGDYFLTAEHLNYAHGPGEVYRLVATFAGPKYELVFTQDALAIAEGQAALLPVDVKRSGYTGPIELTANGAAEGRTTVPEKFAGRVQLPVRALSASGGGLRPVRVVGTATIDGRELKVAATGREALTKAMNGLRYPPVNWVHEVDLAVTEAPPVLIRQLPPIRALPGSTTSIRVDLDFRDGDSAVSLAWRNLPDKITAEPATTAPGQHSARLEWQIAADAKPGEVGPALLTATVAGRVASVAVPVTIVPPQPARPEQP